MVQGLAFLSKKSWHTKNISNQEKVWIAEEREKDEKAKTAELAKQIQQEREDDELNQIAGKQKLDRGIDWMYTGYHKDSETAKEDAAKEAEEYLLGKEFAPAAKLVGDLDTVAADSHAGVNAVVASAAAAAYNSDDDDRKRPAYYQQEEDSVAQRNEAFRLRHEDPMFAVSLQAVRKEKSMEQRKDLYEKAGILLRAVPTGSSGDRENGSQKVKKETKKKKKSKKHHRSDSSDPQRNDDRDRKDRWCKHDRRERRRHDDDDDDDDDSYHRRSKSHRRRSNRDREDRLGKNSPRRGRRSPSTDTHGDGSMDFRAADSHNDRTRHDRDRLSAQRRRKISEQEDGDYRRPDSYAAAQHDHQSRKGTRKPPPPSATVGQHQRGSSETNNGSAISGNSPAMYGLQREKSHTQVGGSDDLGPNQELLQRKRQEREAERYRIKESSRRRNDQTRAEREAALSAMKRDAAVHAATRDRHQRSHHHDDKDEVGLQEAGQPGTSFLRAVAQRAHGINTDMHVSMSSRLQQNRNTNQRSNDESFL